MSDNGADAPKRKGTVQVHAMDVKSSRTHDPAF